MEMARAYILVALAFIAFVSGEMNRFGQNTGSTMAIFPPAPPPGNIKNKIKVQPPPMTSFNPNAWLGPWVYQYWKVPCSWATAEEFTDYTQFLELQGKLMVTHETSRNNNICNTVTSIISVSSPGKLIGKDLTGSNWSGVIVVVATDYKRFSITWGCTRWSAFDGTCDDPYIAVKTRKIKMTMDMHQEIESVLQRIFGISVNNLTKMRHGQPCQRGQKQG